MTLTIRDVRAEMPNFESYRDTARAGDVTGIAVHHSATANPVTGVSLDEARTIFQFHVETRGWSHGGYHYLVRPNGIVEYALDERIPAFHAGFQDPENRLGLEFGQYWNNHLLAVCVLGWFESDRLSTRGPIPNRFTAPTPPQWRALVALLRDLLERYSLGADSVKGHSELVGCHTRCPGANFDLNALRAALRTAPGTVTA